MSIPKLSETNSQVNISNSILRHFSCPTFHQTYSPLDNILDHIGDKKICLFLLDGFGKYIQKKSKSLCPFIYSHGKFDIDAVYPPTTVAATTAILSGKYPCETGYLGWTQYWKRSNEYLQTFSGIREGSDVHGSITPGEILHYKSIIEIINERNGDDSAHAIHGFNCKNEQGEMSSGIFFQTIEETLKKPETKFIYAYWPEPDHSLHAGGIYSKDTQKAIMLLNESIELITKRNPDVVFLSIADHGHVPVKWIDIRKYPDFMDTLVDGRFSIEPRLASFIVKEDKKQEFEKAYKAHFSKKFELLTKEQAYNNNIFGYGEHHKLLDELVGDYIMVSTGKYSLYSGFNYNGLVWTHAGATKEERIVELGVYNINE